MASRVLNSPRRATARASSSVPTLAQEISSNIRTDACRLHSVRSSAGVPKIVRAGFASIIHLCSVSG